MLLIMLTVLTPLGFSVAVEFNLPIGNRYEAYLLPTSNIRKCKLEGAQRVHISAK